MNTGIIFDLDGTLWDATEQIANSWNIVLKRHHYTFRVTAEQIAKECGKMMEPIADSIFSFIEIPERYALLSECLKYENAFLKENGGTLYEGVEEVLWRLNKKYKVFIVSNGQRDYVKNFIEFFSLEKEIPDYEEAGRTGKPKAENIRLIMERNHLSQAFYVGDTLGDMEAADQAGVPFIHAAYGFGTVPEGREKVDNIRKLPRKIEDMMKIVK